MQDAWADVKLLLLLNIIVLFSGGLAKRILVDGEAPAQTAGYWGDIYDVWHHSFPRSSGCAHASRPPLRVMVVCVPQVLVLWFGQFPDGTDSLASQLFAVAMATVGLGAFAIVLALVEQVLTYSPFLKPPLITFLGRA